MIRIDQKFLEIEAQREEEGAIKFFSNSKKKHREWQVLGAIHRQLTSASFDAPYFAIEKEPPDFVTYTKDEKLWSFVEVVEVLRPGYKRNDFWKERAKPDAPITFPVDPPLADLWTPLQKEISGKASKGYQSPILLAVYYDIARSCFPDWGKPFDQYLLEQHKAKPFSDLEKFDRVLVLNCDLKGLVELHPSPTVIVRDNPFGD